MHFCREMCNVVKNALFKDLLEEGLKSAKALKWPLFPIVKLLTSKSARQNSVYGSTDRFSGNWTLNAFSSVFELGFQRN